MNVSTRVARIVRQSVAKANAAFYHNNDLIFEAKPQEVVTPDTVQQTVESALSEAMGYDGTVN